MELAGHALCTHPVGKQDHSLQAEATMLQDCHLMDTRQPESQKQEIDHAQCNCSTDEIEEVLNRHDALNPHISIRMASSIRTESNGFGQASTICYVTSRKLLT
eukprot:4332338-Amphidinium_carterae.2